MSCLVGLSQPFVCWGFMWFLVILNALAKNIIPLIRQKSFLEKTKKGGWAQTSPTEGGSGMPAFTRTTITSKSPSEAVFISKVIKGKNLGGKSGAITKLKLDTLHKQHSFKREKVQIFILYKEQSSIVHQKKDQPQPDTCFYSML